MTLSATDPTNLTGDAFASARARRLAGIGFMCLALMCFAALDSTAKWLSRDLPVMQVVFSRYFGAFLLMSLVMNPWRAPLAWHTPKLWMQTIRGLSLLGSTVCNFVALRSLPMADVMAINFSSPFVIALLAGPILGERVGLRQWGAIGFGFLGVLVITRPGTASMEPAVIWSICSVGCGAVYAITTRQLSQVASVSSMLLISAGLPTLLIAPALPSAWVWPVHGWQWLLLAQLGFFGYIGHFFMIKAYSLAPAPIVAPFTYTQMVWAALLGYILFGDTPGLNTAVGAGIVIASGLYLLFLETGHRRKTPDPLPPPAE